MINRKLAKANGKADFRNNYWRSVLAATFPILATCATSLVTLVINATNAGYQTVNSLSSLDASSINAQEIVSGSTSSNSILPVIIGGLVFVVSIAFILFSDIFVGSPLDLGARRFFVDDTADDTADVDRLMNGFQSPYKNKVKVMFGTKLRIFLWSLLFVIPGIIKYYEYYCVPYILNDNPNASLKDILNKSKTMMAGNKWKAFIFDLSFILWHMLTAITCGLAGIFYVHPYYYSSQAELYAQLSGKQKANA